MIDKFRVLLLTTGAVTLPLFFLPLTPEDPFLIPKQILLSALACIALVALLCPLKNPFHDIPEKILWSSLLFSLSIALSILINSTYHAGIDELKRWMYLFIIFFTSLKIPWDTMRIQKFIKVNIVICTIVSLSAILEFYGILPFYLYPFVEGRLYSFFGHQNIMAQYVMVIFICGIGLTFSRISVKVRIIYSTVLIIIGIALVLSFSRGAIISTLLGVLVLIFAGITKHRLNEKYKKAILILMGVFIIIGVSLIVMVNSDGKTSHQIMYMLSRGDTGRFDIWNKTLQTIYTSPLFGVGLGNYSTSSHGYVHNELLQLLVETGITGLFGFFIFLFAVFSNYRKRQILYTAEDKVLPFTFFAACFATAVHSMVSYDLHSATSSYLFFIGLGILCAENKNEQKKVFKESITKKAILIACLLIIISLWSFHGEYKKFMGHYYFSKSNLLLKSRDESSSIAFILKAIEFQPYNSRYHLKAGYLYSRIRMYELSQRHYKKAIKFEKIRYD